MYKRTSPLKQFATPAEDKLATATTPEQPSNGAPTNPSMQNGSTQPITGMAGNPSMQTAQAQTGYPPMDNAIPKINPTPLMQRSKIFKK